MLFRRSSSLRGGIVLSRTAFAARFRRRSTAALMAVLPFALALPLLTPPVVATAAPAPLFSDGFESGDLSAWSATAGLSVGPDARSGSWGASGPLAQGAPAYAYEQLSSPEPDLYLRAWFRILAR